MEPRETHGETGGGFEHPEMRVQVSLWNDGKVREYLTMSVH